MLRRTLRSKEGLEEEEFYLEGLEEFERKRGLEVRGLSIGIIKSNGRRYFDS